MPLDEDSGNNYSPKYTKKQRYLEMAMLDAEEHNSTEPGPLEYPNIETPLESEGDKSAITAPVNSDPIPASSQSNTLPLQHPVEAPSNSCFKDRKFSWSSYITSKWCAVSKRILEESETGILACLNSSFNRRFIHINNGIFGNQDVKVWTLSMNESSTETPILLVHGFASGIALWALNLDALANDRPVYCFDLPGFAQSSRPKFGETPEEAEDQYIQTIEEWRCQMNLPTFILLGHSMGAFLCTAYSIQYPERVQHLILADPWGFQEKPEEYKGIGRIPYPIYTIMRFLEPFSVNPLWTLRLLGRMGPQVIQFFRSELIKSFKPEVQDAEKLVSNYICQCNTREPTGETAFTLLMKSFGWAKNPMINRIHLLQYDLPLTLIYGGNSWIDHVSLENLQEKRGISTLIDLHVLPGTGHHVYTNKNTLNLFNKIVVHACHKLRVPLIIQRNVEENQGEELLHLQTMDWENQSDETQAKHGDNSDNTMPCVCPLTDMNKDEELLDYEMESDSEYEYEVDMDEMEDMDDIGPGPGM